MFSEIVKFFGTDTVRIADIKEHFPKMVGQVMRNATRVQRGVYYIGNDRPTEVSEPIIENVVHIKAVETEPSTPMKTFNHLIPVVDKAYVPHGCYNVVTKVLKSGVFAPVYVTGPSGNGKTMGIAQACAKLKIPAVIINISNETDEESLIGSYTLQNGNLEWRDGPLLEAYRNGLVCVLDELDQARSSIMALQTIAQFAPYYIKQTNEVVYPKEGFQLFATSNTKGDGSGADKFVGAQILNSAFLERFNIFVDQDYPTEAVEKRILSKLTDDKNLIERLVRFAGITRRALQAGSITDCMTTRRLCQIIKNMEIFGKEQEAFHYAISRFDNDTRDAFKELYSKMQKEIEADEESIDNPDQF